MKKTTLFIVCIFSSTMHSLSSQNYLGTTATWSYAEKHRDGTHGPGLTYNTFFHLNGDTTINNKSFKKLYESSDSIFNQTKSSYYCAIREMNMKWYFCYPGSTFELLRVNFDVKLGDQFYLGYRAWISSYDHSQGWYPDSIKYAVNQLDTITVGNNKFKRFKIDKSSSEIPYDYWIEGIGSLYFFDVGFWGRDPANIEKSYILCFHNDYILSYSNPLYNYCGVNSGIIMPIENHKLLILQDKSSNHIFQLKSSSEITSIFVYNTQGKIVQKTAPYANDAIVSLASQPRGVYLVRVSTADGVFVRKIVKK